MSVDGLVERYNSKVGSLVSATILPTSPERQREIESEVQILGTELRFRLHAGANAIEELARLKAAS
jgi:hypothetical protein